MPLIKSGSKKALKENIRELYRSRTKRPRKQIIAIAMSNQRKYS